MPERAVLKWIDFQTLEDGRTVVTAVAEIDGTYHGAGYGIVRPRRPDEDRNIWIARVLEEAAREKEVQAGRTRELAACLRRAARRQHTDE